MRFNTCDAGALTPMPDEAVAAVVHSIVDAGVVLPGINGEAIVAAGLRLPDAPERRSRPCS